MKTNVCTCYPNFNGFPCRCYYRSYINLKTNLCNPCTTLPTTALKQSCRSCTGNFKWSNIGCIDCLTLENNGGSSSCCATGFYFDQTQAKCICDSYQNYSVNANGVCTKCAQGDNNCIYCSSPYVNNLYYCIHGSLI